MVLDPIVEQSPEVRRVRSYEEDLRQHRFRPELDRCPRCKCPAEGRGFFRFHDRRARTFLVVVERLVYKVKSVICRWRCRVCKKPFTLYPPFALPHKRYVLPVFKHRCPRYVEDETQTYRKGVLENGMLIFHASEQNQEGPNMSHTTLYRWVTTFGRLEETLREAWALLKQKGSVARLSRQLKEFEVPGRKYDRESRKDHLYRCWSLWKIDGVYVRRFAASVFPDLATLCAWA